VATLYRPAFHALAKYGTLVTRLVLLIETCVGCVHAAEVPRRAKGLVGCCAQVLFDRTIKGPA
jgi:hypothetical protein